MGHARLTLTCVCTHKSKGIGLRREGPLWWSLLCCPIIFIALHSGGGGDGKGGGDGSSDEVEVGDAETLAITKTFTPFRQPSEIFAHGYKLDKSLCVGVSAAHVWDGGALELMRILSQHFSSIYLKKKKKNCRQ